MVKAVVGKWGKNIALRMPAEIVQTSGLALGEEVDVDTQGRKIVITRPAAEARAKAEAAARRIRERSKGHSLAGLSIRELIGRDDH